MDTSTPYIPNYLDRREVHNRKQRRAEEARLRRTLKGTRVIVDLEGHDGVSMGYFPSTVLNTEKSH